VLEVRIDRRDGATVTVDDCARARRAFLARETERGGDHAGNSGVQIGIVGDDDCVLAAHLGDRPLDPALAGLRLRRQLGDPQPDALRPGERDEPRARVGDELLADRGTVARDEVQDARRQAELVHEVDERRGDHRGVG